MVKIIENYQLQEVIGEGQYGKVYKAKDTKNSIQVAIKVVPILKFKENPKLEECTINEIKMLSMLQKQEKNDHIVKFIELLKTQNNYYFVYDFCNGGTLEKYLLSQKFFNEQRALKVFAQILNAFRSLVQYNIMHRDLKPTNILLHDGVIKLADFGFCTSLKSKNDMAKTMLGSPIYMAPEILRGYEYCIKADIWSLGVVLYEMLYGYCPFEERTIARLISVQDFGKLEFCNSLNPVSEETKALIVKMLIKDPVHRISWEQLFNYQVTEEGNLFYNESQQPIQQQEVQKQNNIVEQPTIQKHREMSKDPKQASNPSILPQIAQTQSKKSQETKLQSQQDLLPLEIVKAQSQNQQNGYLKDDFQNKNVVKQQKYRRESLNYNKTEQEFSSLKKIQQVDRKIGSGIKSPDKKSFGQLQLEEDSFKKNKILQDQDRINSNTANYSQTVKNLYFQAENKENQDETTPYNKYISKIPALDNTKFSSQQKKYEENPYKNQFRESLKEQNGSQKENLFFTMNNNSKLNIADNLPEPPKILKKKNYTRTNIRSNTIHFDSSEQLPPESKNYNFGISLRDQDNSPKPFAVKQKQCQPLLSQNQKNLLIYFLARLLNQTIQNNLNHLTPELAYNLYIFIQTLIPEHNKQSLIEPLMEQLRALFIQCNLPSQNQKFFTFQEKYCKLVVQYCQEVFKVKENRFNERIIIHMILVLQSVCLQEMNKNQGMSSLTDILESKDGFQGHLDNLLTLKIGQLWKKYEVLMSKAREL